MRDWLASGEPWIWMNAAAVGIQIDGIEYEVNTRPQAIKEDTGEQHLKLPPKELNDLFKKASSKDGVTGENLLQFLESRLDNTVFRMGIAPTRRAARQLVSHKHILVNGVVSNIPSFLLRPNDVVSVRNKSRHLEAIQNSIAGKSDIRNFGWLEWNPDRMEGKFMEYPDREKIPEKINEQLIVELYSK